MNLSQALEIASCTDPGIVRSHNEDSIAADASKGLVVLADGMGGYNAGEIASGIAISTVQDTVKREWKNLKHGEIDPQTGHVLATIPAHK